MRVSINLLLLVIRVMVLRASPPTSQQMQEYTLEGAHAILSHIDTEGCYRITSLHNMANLGL